MTVAKKLEKQGFFFAVQEQKVLELSAVIFASNEYTPILGAENKALVQPDPSLDTQHNDDSLERYKMFEYLNSM